MPGVLPEEFVFSHDYCVYLHDCIAQFVVEGERGRFFETTFEFCCDEHAGELERNPDLLILDWLQKRGYSDVLQEVLLKAIFPALVSDFCHFVFEALACSKKAKLTVAYALLRKPLREDLHYLEWMLADPKGLLETFYSQPSKELSFDKIGDPDRAKAVIRQAATRTLHSEIYDPAFLYDLRFKKGAAFGFDALWNKAIHLITTRDTLATEQANFNFVFSGDDERWVQWRHIYMTLPYLLFYALDVCEALMALMAAEVASDIAEVSLHRSLGFIMWARDSRGFSGTPGPAAGQLEFPALKCPRCGQRIPPDEELMRNLFDERQVECPSCGQAVRMRELGDAQ